MISCPVPRCPELGSTPGAVAANAKGFRPSNGNSTTRRCSTTFPKPDVCASNCTAVADTSTASVRVPTSSEKLIVAVRPTVSRSPVTRAGRNPAFSDVTSYSPGGSAGMK